MSQEAPVSSIDANKRKFYNTSCTKLAPREVLSRSGILERYTYKTDSGQLISTSLNTESNKSQEIIKTYVDNQIYATKVKDVLITDISKQADTHKYVENTPSSFVEKDQRTEHWDSRLKVGNSSQDVDKVRTEHCDSTTDIIEEKFAKDALKMFDLHENISTMLTRKLLCNSFTPISNSTITCLPQQSFDVDSDSDCQIVDGKNCSDSQSLNNDTKERFTVSLDGIFTKNTDKSSLFLKDIDIDSDLRNTKVLSWISKTEEANKAPLVHIISDSDEDENPNINEITNSLRSTELIHLCEKTGVLCVDIKSSKSENSSVSSDNPKFACDINTDVKVTLPSAVRRATLSNISSSLPNSSEKESLILLNQKYHSVKNLIQGGKSSTANRNTLNMNLSRINAQLKPPETCSKSPDRTLPKQDAISLLNTTEDNSLIQTVENIANAPLSPESIMKSEFYSYLKINTNPSAQKAEIVAKHRRSVRVKNIIKQIEKSKELHGLHNEEPRNEKSSGIRKQYMQYSKRGVCFPDVPVHHNTISDFQGAIEAWFVTEGVNYKQLLSPTVLLINNFPTHTIFRKESKQETTPDNLPKRKSEESDCNRSEKKQKLIHRQKLVKNSLSKQNIRKKNRNSNISVLSDTKLRRLRFRPNRILRGEVRITRNFLDGYRCFTPKHIKTRKSNLNIKIIRNKNIGKNTQEETTTTITNAASTILNTTTVETTNTRENTDADESKRIVETLTKDNTSISHQDNVQRTVLHSNICASPSLPDILSKKLTDAINSNMSAKDIAVRNKWLKRSAELEKANKIKKRVEQISTEKTSLTIKSIPIIPIKDIQIEVNSVKTVSNNLSNLKKNPCQKDPLKTKAKSLSSNQVKDISLEANSQEVTGSNSLNHVKNVCLETIALNKQSESFNLSDIKEIPLAINAFRAKSVSFNLNDIKEITLTEAPTSDQELELLNKTSTSSKSENCCENKDRSSSPFCFGFLLDDDIIRIRESMQNAVTRINSSPVIMNDSIDKEVFMNKQPEMEENTIITKAAFHIPAVVITVPENEDNGTNESITDEQMSETSSIHEESHINEPDVIDTDKILSGNRNYIPLNPNIRTKSFHRSLIQATSKCKSNLDTSKSNLFEYSDSDSSISTQKTHRGSLVKRSATHEIDISKNNGAVFNAYFINGILVIVQELLITFWKQTALGNILGVQNMWLPHGNLQRIILDPGCVNRRSSEMILTVENVVAYIELWTKEHKCVYRECPIADVFATIYFHKGHGPPDKKVLQLENIKGYGDDVRFAVIKSSREIIVSWCDTFAKPIKTMVRGYQLTSDFQSISSIKEMEYVSHYISSLHNIHDCENMVLGAGNEQISVWNLQHGYLVTTLNLSESTIQPPLENKTICLYAQCDTGFLFLVQQIDIGVLRLVAVNGLTHEWKQLHSYQVPDNYKKLLGVIVESGVLMTCYTNGFLCWNMHNGEILAEIDTTNEHIVLPSNKYLVAIDNYQVTVQHIMSYILTHDW